MGRTLFPWGGELGSVGRKKGNDFCRVLGRSEKRRAIMRGVLSLKDIPPRVFNDKREFGLRVDR